MIYLKATAVGILGALALAAVWVLSALLIPMWWQMWQQRNQLGGRVGAGGVGFWIGSGSVLLAALIGFLLGFAWTMRRTPH